MSAQKAREAGKALFIQSKGQMTNAEIARRVDRDDAQISRWKKADCWEDELVGQAIGLSDLDLEEVERVMDNINWASPDPLGMDEINSIMTIIYKGFLRQLMRKIIYGGININNFYQADQFMGRIEATIRRIQGDPDVNIKHIHEIEEMPGAEKDDDAIIHGMKRMHALMEQRKRRALQAGEDMVDIELITDGDTLIDGEVVDEE